jgi:acyl carrier protein
MTAREKDRTMEQSIRRILYERGMTSHAVVDVMLELEEEFDFEFPDELLRKSTFQTLANLQGALGSIGVSAEP